MNEPHARKVARRIDSFTATTGSGDAFTEDVHFDNCRRLAGMGLVYFLGYTLAWGSSLIIEIVNKGRVDDVTQIPIGITGIALGLVVYFVSRSGHLPQRAFANLASGFLIVGSVGIVAGSWNWQSYWADRFIRAAGALGIPPAEVRTGFIDPIDAVGAPLLFIGGVTWVGVFILSFPLIIPASPLRVLLSGLLAATLSIAVPVMSVVVHGVPEVIEPWTATFIAEFTIPTYVCVLLAWIGSRTGYKLARALSSARRMGSYELTERIGEGGMGEVWRARHRMLARPAAIKLIRPEMLGSPADSQVALSRFTREAQATAELESPHTIELYDFGVTDEGVFYYVMELLDGFDLDTLVGRFGPLPASRCAHLLAQAAHSLADAHASGLVHRDIKPANVFTCRRGQDHDFVKVLDFGLVKPLETQGDDVGITREGQMAGTPAYMAPETVMSGAADHRADLYALGCVGYWLLTGRPVFESDSPMGVLVQHVNEPPPPASTLTELPVPAALDTIILECLAKKPEDRPASASVLRARLLAAIDPSDAWSTSDADGWWEHHAPARVLSAPASPTPSKHVTRVMPRSS